MFIRELLVTGGCAAFLVLYLLVERLLLAQNARSIPLRICVTGTRGKSSVTRLIAASLRDAGFSVLAKTTGAKPVLILPDGSEKEIARRGTPTILEEKKIVKIGAKLSVQALVLELMSIHPESIFVESVHMLRPHVLVITNVRQDHLAQMGTSREDIARCFASSIPERCTVFIPQEECLPVFQKTAEKLGSKIIHVHSEIFEEYIQSKEKFSSFEFEQNIRLALAVSNFLGVNKEVAMEGMEKALPDFGSLKVWTAEIGTPSCSWYFVSGFAANDPESTRLVLERLREKRLFVGRKMIGLLNFRGDRGDRTLQWLEAMNEGAFSEFHRFVFVGEHAPAFKKRLKLIDKTEFYVLKKRDPEEIMAQLQVIENEEAVLVGMGNMGGIGESLVDYWDNIGKRYDI